MVSDEGGHFSPAGVVSVYTLSLLLSSQAAHGRAAGNTKEHKTRVYTETTEENNRRVTHGYNT